METRSSRSNDGIHRKRFYKDVWFWLFIVMTCLFLMTFSVLTVYVNDDETNNQVKVEKKNSKSQKSNQGSKKNKSTKTTYLNPGDAELFKTSDSKITISIDSAQRVDANNDMVTDISHNYDSTTDYVIVNYTVTSLTGSLDTNLVDGSEFNIFDSNQTSTIQSSNRDPGTPDYISDGQTAHLRIGIGLETQSDFIYVKMDDSTWKIPVS
ncbi:hypothetical protein [Lactobacillus terrae]|uniref:hypothetical protein n=1 Tax=Lactobacillus terrae TaxID=2269374 RepID=UPI000C1B64D2|nr:hypothetical protein [Lactobacillus terrae]